MNANSLTTMTLTGALLGLLAGCGLLLVFRALPWGSPPKLAQRIDPYLRTERRELVTFTDSAHRFRRVAVLMAGPVAQACLGVLERITGGREQLQRRLLQAGRSTSTDMFRIEQVFWVAGGLVAASAAVIIAMTVSNVNLVMGFIFVVLGAVTGAVARDVALTQEIKRRHRRITRELPAAADLLALAVGAGESPVAAMERVASVTHGALSQELAAVVADIRAGATIDGALAALSERAPIPALGRFADGIATAVERGSPLADVMRAQAQDAREAAKRELMESAGKREIYMLVPVVFLVLPLVIVFAMLPGLAILQIAL